MTEKQFYEFGPFHIDVALNRLARAGVPVPLPPKAFDLLLFLARNPDRVVAKEDLMQALWPDTFVEDANLSQHIYTLRKSLGDQPDGEPYITTIPRRGYRLAVPVREGIEGAPGAEPRREPERREPPVVHGERKQATVLDCRVDRASDVIDRLGPAAMRAALGELEAVVLEEVARFDGVLTQRHADGFVAVFGARAVHEDDARRAVLAAHGIHHRVGRLAAQQREDDAPIALRIGVSTGPLVISRTTSGDAVEYSAVGEALSVADRLQQWASPGDTLISGQTRRLVEAHIDMSPAGADAFRVAGLRAGGRALRASARVESRFVGRQHERGIFEDLVVQAASGKGQVLTIVGEPGIGKSRLLRECAHTVAAPGGLVVLEARCVSYGGPIPYVPLIDLVRAHCGIGDSEPLDAVRAAVGRAAAVVGLSDDAAQWLVRLVDRTDGGDTTLSPQAVKGRTFDTLWSLLCRASARAPLLLAIEDVHWIDRTSEEFLAGLVDRLPGVAIMVAATCRPGHRVQWMDRSSATQLTLRPLTRPQAGELLESILPERAVTPAATAAIVEKGDGNPFFLEELARSAADGATEGSQIPESVHGVIMARIDKLPDSTKRLLQTAAVLGRAVPQPWLARVWGGDFASEIGELCRLDFAYEQQGEELTLVFKHALTQDVAYDSLLARDRSDLHLKAAQTLIALRGDACDDLAGSLAYHYSRTDRAAEAVHWLIRAADRAARVYANAEAVVHLDLAARRVQRLAQGTDRDRSTIDIALRHAHSLYFLGRFQESVDLLLPQEARIARLADPRLTGAYFFWLAHMYSRLGDQRRATESAWHAIRAATEARDEETLGKAHGLLSLEGHWSGASHDGIEHGVKAVALLRPHASQRWWLGMVHFYLALNYLVQGDFASALAAAADANGVGIEIGDPRLQTYAGFTTAWIETTRGNTSAAVATARRAVDQAPDRVSRAYASMIRGFALLESGDYRQAGTILEPTVSELEAFGIAQWQGFAAALMADACRSALDFERARSFVTKALEAATRAQYWYGVGFTQRIDGRIAREAGDPVRAAASFDRAVQTFERIGARHEASRTRAEAAKPAKPGAGNRMPPADGSANGPEAP